MVEFTGKLFYPLHSDSPSGTEEDRVKTGHVLLKKERLSFRGSEPCERPYWRVSQFDFAPEGNPAVTFFGFPFLAIPVLPAHFFPP